MTNMLDRVEALAANYVVHVEGIEDVEHSVAAFSIQRDATNHSWLVSLSLDQGRGVGFGEPDLELAISLAEEWREKAVERAIARHVKEYRVADEVVEEYDRVGEEEEPALTPAPEGD